MVLAFWKRRKDMTPYAIYSNVAEAARAPALFERIGVPDTITGRFDMLIAHAILAFRRLNRVEGDRKQEAAARAQAFSDVLFKDLDRALRETGVSDRKVPKRLKMLAEAFLGRGNAFGEALDQKDQKALAEVIGRNLGGVLFHADRTDALTAAASKGEQVSAEALEETEAAQYGQIDTDLLAAYVAAADEMLGSVSDDDAVEGAFRWPDPEAVIKSHLEAAEAQAPAQASV